MLFPNIEQNSTGIRAYTPSWSLEHRRACGGAWSSLIFTAGSGREMLRAPLSSALRFVLSDPHSQVGSYGAYCEHFDATARLSIERTAAGAPVVVAEGVFRDEQGRALPVGFRRRTEYQQYGLIWTTLEIMSDAGCDGVIEVRALDLKLRAGLSDAFVRFHPSQDGGSDLLGGHGWFDLNTAGTKFLSRFTPTQMLLLERNAEGLELFPGSDLAQWDCALKPDPGLGLYRIEQSAQGASIEWNPYCMAFRRLPLRIQGTLKFRLGFGLPDLKPHAKAGSVVFSGPSKAAATSAAVTDSRWASEDEIASLAASGVELMRFQNDYREDGPFWHAGAYPPYDEAGMKELRRVVEGSHRHGMKIVPYISLKEYHPQAPDFALHAREWMHMAAPSLDMIHTWAGGGEYGALMCMKSGWLEFLKKKIKTILKDLPWDGLCLDWMSFHPCCHPSHGRGPYHTDIEELFEFLFFCREQAGAEGLLLLHNSGQPSMIARNVASGTISASGLCGIEGFAWQREP